MPLIIPPGFAQAVFRLTLTGDAEGMVTTCGVDVSGYAGDFQEAAEALYNFFGGSSGPVSVMADDYTFEGVTIYVGQDGGGSIPFDSEGVPIAGGDTDTPLPQNCAMLIRKRTGVLGRRGRGRFYMPGVSEANTSPIGVLSPAILGAYQDAWTFFFEACRDGAGSYDPVPLVVLHASEGEGAEPPPTVITALAVDDLIATQRQRLRR